MRICIVTPAPRRSRHGNRVTALRWARLLRELGHRVRLTQRYEQEGCDLLVALHARRSADSIEHFVERNPGSPVVLALTGTDLYQDLRTDLRAKRSAEIATRLVVLQPLGIAGLPHEARHKARAIFQSATKPPGSFRPRTDVFEVCVLAHLRPVKDPLRAAEAARLLPPSSKIRVLHLGAAMSREMDRQAHAEMRNNPRYRWLGEQPRWKALRILAHSRVLALTSLLEGGANVVSEAIACSVPVVSSRIPGSIGILGPEYPGYFTVGDSQELAELLFRNETDQSFHGSLRDHCRHLAPIVNPAQERQSWKDLLDELFSTQSAAAKAAAGRPKR